MFRIDQSPTFWAPVRFEVQAATGNARQVQEFSAEFPRLSSDELEALGAQAAAGQLSDRQAAQRLLRGWADVGGADGQVLPFTAENMAAVLNVAGVATAVVAAFRAAQPRAALGN